MDKDPPLQGRAAVVIGNHISTYIDDIEPINNRILMETLKGTMPEKCPSCHVLDNENDWLNECLRYDNFNLSNTGTKCHFDDVFSQDSDTLNVIISHLEKIWDFRFTSGRMRKV